jgi:hypothetical protein
VFCVCLCYYCFCNGGGCASIECHCYFQCVVISPCVDIVVAFVMMFLSCVLVCFIMLHSFQVFAFAPFFLVLMFPSCVDIVSIMFF